MRNTLDLNPKFFSCRHIFFGKNTSFANCRQPLVLDDGQNLLWQAQYLRTMLAIFTFSEKQTNNCRCGRDSFNMSISALYCGEWYIIMSTTSMVFSSRLSSPSTVLSTTNKQLSLGRRQFQFEYLGPMLRWMGCWLPQTIHRLALHQNTCKRRTFFPQNLNISVR